MAHKRTFVGETPVYVPDLGREVQPGEEVEFADDPNNGLFVTASEAKKHNKAEEG